MLNGVSNLFETLNYTTSSVDNNTLTSVFPVPTLVQHV